MSIACPQCGEQNQDEAKICSMCGTLMQTASVATATAPPPVPLATAPPPIPPATVPPPVPPAPTAIPPAPIPMQQPGYGYGSATPYGVVYAGFWLRFVASFIDGLLVGTVNFIIGAIVGGIFGAVAGASGASMESITGGAGVLGFIIGTIISWLYFAMMESSSTQGTLGKMALGLKVTDLAGNRIAFGQATGRYFGKIISGIILGIGYIMAGFTEKKQALHDTMAGCLVVRK